MNVSMMAKLDGRLMGWAALTVLTVVGVLATPDVHAALPAVVAPTGAGAATDWPTLIMAYAKIGVMILGLLMGAVGLIMVVGKVMSQYHDVGNGRATWGDVATSATAGAVIMGLSAAVLAAATTVFP